MAVPKIASFREAVAEVGKRWKCVAWDGKSAERISEHHFADPEQKRPANISPAGTPYSEILIGQESIIYLSERSAAQAWLERMFEFGENATTLYWRIEPEYEYEGAGRLKIYREEMDFPESGGVRYHLVGYPVYRIYSRQAFA